MLAVPRTRAGFVKARTASSNAYMLTAIDNTVNECHFYVYIVITKFCEPFWVLLNLAK